MYEGKARIAEQVGGWAVYAEITLTVEWDDHPDGRRRDPSIGFGTSQPLSFEHMQAIGFGVIYALEHLPDPRPNRRYAVVIEEVKSNPVDTKDTPSAFCTARQAAIARLTAV
jgi:hypothetical protein